MLAGKIVKFNLPNVFLNPRNQIWKKLTPADHSLPGHHLMSTATSLPMLGRWDYGTGCVQMTTKHFVVPCWHPIVLVNSRWNLGNAIGHPMLGLDSPHLCHRFVELYTTRLLMIWHLEFAIGPPTPSKGHRVYEVLLQWPQLAHGSQTCTLSLFRL